MLLICGSNVYAEPEPVDNKEQNAEAPPKKQSAAIEAILEQLRKKNSTEQVEQEPEPQTSEKQTDQTQNKGASIDAILKRLKQKNESASEQTSEPKASEKQTDQTQNKGASIDAILKRLKQNSVGSEQAEEPQNQQDSLTINDNKSGRQTTPTPPSKLKLFWDDLKSKTKEKYNGVEFGVNYFFYKADNNRVFAPDTEILFDTVHAPLLSVGVTLDDVEIRAAMSNMTVAPKDSDLPAINTLFTSLDAIQYFGDDQFSIYFLAGLNNIEIPKSQTLFGVGNGMKYHIADRVDWLLEFKLLFQLDSDGYSDFALTSGFTYKFGGTINIKREVEVQKKEEKIEVISAKDRIKALLAARRNKAKASANCPEINKAVSRLECQQIKELLKGDMLTLYFEENGIAVRKEHVKELNVFKLIQEAYPDALFVISGHSSVPGDNAENFKISLDRANAVSDYFVNEFGSDRNKITVKAFGEERLRLQGETEEVNRVNQRVEITVTVD